MRRKQSVTDRMIEGVFRPLPYCIACGSPKDNGELFCWDCFKGGETDGLKFVPFQRFSDNKGGTIRDWLRYRTGGKAVDIVAKKEKEVFITRIKL